MTERQFDAHATDYNATVQRAIGASGESVQFFADLKVDLMLGALTDSAPSRILDFGCGIGNTTRSIAARFSGARVTGVDQSQESLAVARRAPNSSPSTEYERVDGSQLPFADATFDVAFTACVFHHIEPPERLTWMAELLRVLRPGGSLFLFEHNPRNPLTVRVVRSIPFDEGVVLLDGKETATQLRLAGFDAEPPAYYFFFPASLRFLRPLEQLLHRVPFGAQYYVVARKHQ